MEYIKSMIILGKQRISLIGRTEKILVIRLTKFEMDIETVERIHVFWS